MKDTSRNLKQALYNFEKLFITRILIKYKWHRAKAAKAMGIPRRNLDYKINKFKIRQGDLL